MVSLNLFLKFFVFSRQKFLIKDQFEFGLNPHEVLQCFRLYSKIILDSDRLTDCFMQSCFHVVINFKINFDSANDNISSSILALRRYFWSQEGVESKLKSR